MERRKIEYGEVEEVEEEDQRSKISARRRVAGRFVDMVITYIIIIELVGGGTPYAHMIMLLVYSFNKTENRGC